MTATNRTTQSILDYLANLPGAICWRNNAIPVRGRRFVGERGVGDIIGCYNGRHIEIEVKTGRDSQSKVQEKHQAEIERCGGLYIIAHTFDDFIKNWKEVR